VSTHTRLERPRPQLYLTIFIVWAAALFWFHPRLTKLLTLARTPFQTGALLFFIVFTELAWLYGFYNIGVIAFAQLYRLRSRRLDLPPALPEPAPAVAVLYTTCNDFVEESAATCVAQNYPNYTVYVLDDSTEPAFRERVDAFAARYPERVRVVRRGSRQGFKAGNLNHALTHAATSEPLFALVDADELLPPNFLRRMVPRVLADERCGFAQANHRCIPDTPGSLGDAMGVGIDIHWRWYQPLRNRYGFVMLLGHGAVLRRAAWEEIGGFPEIVSEDLGYALRIREHGWRGLFVEDVVCKEAFPETIRAFRVRHMKWTRGTCEFLSKEMTRALWSRRVSLVEKLDVLFPTLSLPLSLFYFLYIVDANLIIVTLFGHARPLTLALGGTQMVVPVWGLDQSFREVMSADFYFITLTTFVAPILCFIIELARQPGVLFRFLCRSSTVYAALGPMSCLGVLSYLITGKAKFLVTGDRRSAATPDVAAPSPIARLRAGVRRLLSGSHPDHPVVQGFELLCGITFGATCLALLQISFLGLAISFILLPVLHHVSWEHPLMQRLIYLPFLLILAGISLGGLGVLGVQAVFFGYGFHF
jgi:cellulose synthase/poly-beta-1,6-N-acetylglucosamine synthase-like glycosyltransferase